MEDTLTLTIGNIKITTKEKEIDTESGGSSVILEESNKIYVEGGVSLNNEDMLKLNYEPVTDTINLGWVKKVKEDAYHQEIETEILPVKIARWTKEGEESENTKIDEHISDKIAHISQEENIVLSQASGLFELIDIKYGEPETVSLAFIPNSKKSIRKFRHFCLENEEKFSFNTFRLKKPQYEQNLGFPIFLKIILVKSHNEEDGDLLAVSSNSIDIDSITDDKDYFEWNFSQTIEVEGGQYIMLTFLKDAKILKEHTPIFVASTTGEVNGTFGTCIRCEDTETIIENNEVTPEDSNDGPTISYTPNDLINYAPESSFVLQDANYIFFK